MIIIMMKIVIMINVIMITLIKRLMTSWIKTKTATVKLPLTIYTILI